jgi:hypothetical protein
MDDDAGKIVLMKPSLQMLLISSLSLIITGCASTKAFFADRGRDALDMVTLGAGIGWGAKVRTGPLQTGLLADMSMASLRGGELHVDSRKSPSGEPTLLAYEGQVIACGSEIFESCDLPRNKNFVASTWLHEEPKGAFFYRGVQPKQDPAVHVPYYWTQFEVVADVGIGIRAGVNPGEILDFILGWTTLDIFHDDIGLLQSPSFSE